MSRVRVLLAMVALLVALVLQVSVLGAVSWQGVVPNLCLLVVVACGLTLPPSQAMVLGFVAGLLLDLAPPADHVAGRWALALSVVAFVVARVRPDVRPTALGVVATVAAASFVGCSLYALSGVLLSDPGTSVGDTSQEPFTEGYAPRETAWEAALSEAFGERFINVRVFLIKHGLDISGLAPTEEDVADARLGCISKQLRSDWTHLNARGYFAKAVAIYRRGVRLGYWSAGEGSIDVAVPHGHHQQAEGQGQGQG